MNRELWEMVWELVLLGLCLAGLVLLSLATWSDATYLF